MKTRITLITIALLLIALGSAAVAIKQRQAYIVHQGRLQGHDAYNHKHYALAITHLSRFLATTPGSATDWLALADSLENTTAPSSSLQALQAFEMARSAPDATPESAAICNRRIALIRLRLNQPLQAIQYARLAAQTTDSPEDWALVALAQVKAGNPTQASQTLAGVKTLSAQNPLINLLGCAISASNDSLGPVIPGNMAHLDIDTQSQLSSWLLLSQGKHQQALDVLIHAARLTRTPQTLRAAGILAFYLDHYDQALSMALMQDFQGDLDPQLTLIAILAADRTDGMLRNRLINSITPMGSNPDTNLWACLAKAATANPIQPRDLAQATDAALARCSNSPVILHLRARALQLAGEPHVAITWARRAQIHAPAWRSLDGYITSLIHEAQSPLPADSIAADWPSWSQARQQGPGAMARFLQNPSLADDSKRFNAAVEALRQQSPSDAIQWRLLEARSLLRPAASEAQIAKAGILAREAVGFAPQSPAAHLLLGACQVRISRFDDALHSLLTAVNLDPRMTPQALTISLTFPNVFTPGQATALVRFVNAATAIQTAGDSSPSAQSLLTQRLLALADLGHRANNLHLCQASYRSILQHDPSNHLAANNLAAVMLLSGTANQETLILAQDAVRLAPRQPQYLLTLHDVRRAHIKPPMALESDTSLPPFSSSLPLFSPSLFQRNRP
jgi:tetratricopeptide (TPR) repeat protein